MEEPKWSCHHDDQDEFHDALDDFPFYDAFESFSEPIEPRVSIQSENPNLSPADNDLSRPDIRRRRSKLRNSRKSEESASELGNSDPLETKFRSNSPESTVIDEKGETSEQPSTVTNATAPDTTREDLARNGSSLRDHEEEAAHSSLLLTLAGIVIKCISFQILLSVKVITFPIHSLYYLYMLAYDPFGFSKSCREYLFGKINSIWSSVYQLVTEFINEWFKEHQSIWKLVLKCLWGLMWSCYVCAVLVGLLFSAFVTSGILIKVVVEEPTRIQRSLNFDYKEKSPVAYVPIVTGSEFIHDMYLGENRELGKGGGSRIIPPYHKLKVTVALTLPESEYNQNLGVFQVRVDFLAADGQILATSRRPCMLQFRSPPIRLLLTLLKLAPILTGYTSETQNININFRGFTEGLKPTANLRVVMEQRAEFSPGGGIPEIYNAHLTLESELPLVKRVLWFWKKTLFVWISMVIFTVELFLALLCCRPIVIPRICQRRAVSNRSTN
ncbi:Putative adipose-regulatory protein (Seipin [Striga hermonthica]|uniref:Adipose-regulatory protein (Seipin) n=1 Tax=Striga hermonthica TaxID=68872 RepID=A0A9N7RJ51_STRHE|nr:Putative adipose-regulatory protein (Seipin [Striga hermonthica]